MKYHFLGECANECLDLEDRALRYAIEMHAGQTDKAGESYITHAMRVADSVGGNPTLRAIAYLHDVVEDTDATIKDVCERFGYGVSEIVDKLTRRKDESYEDYIKRLSSSHRARVVKIADLVDNMNLTRLPALSLKDAERQRKYANALCALMKLEEIMDKNRLIFNLGYSMWDYADLSEQELDHIYHERCIKNMSVDVFLDEDICANEDYVIALYTKQPSIRFYCTLCYEDDNSYGLIEMCDDESIDLCVVADELKEYDPDTHSMLYIDRYELHTDVFDARDVQRIMNMVPQFVYDRMNIMPEYIAMLHPTSASYNVDCYPMGMMDHMVELGYGVFVRETDCE